MNSKLYLSFVKTLAVMFITCSFFAAPFISAEISEKKLNADIDSLGGEVDELARDIALLERELLFPPLTRLSFYVSLSVDAQFSMQTITLLIDGGEESFHIYSKSDIAALRIGGVQRLWEGNVALGQHKLSVKVKGMDGKKRLVEKVIPFTFEKKNDGHSIELEIKAESESKTPIFSMKDWGEA